MVPGEARRDEVLVDFRAAFGDRLYAARTDRDRIEVMHPDVNKSIAIGAIAESAGVSLAETLAIGDGDNDLPMLASAGIGALMGNADEETRRDAEGQGIVSIPGIEEDGFSAAIQRYVFGTGA